MPKYKLLALTTPVAGKEKEYHDWYNNVHLPELLTFNGMKKAQRYKLETKLIGADTNPFLAIYDIECPDGLAFLGEMGQAAASGKLTQSDAADMSSTYTALFSEYGEPVLPKA